MEKYKQIFYILFGKFKRDRKLDYFINILIIVYIIMLFPSLILAILIGIRSGFGPEKNIGVIKKILFHIAMLFWSFCLWGLIITALN